MTRISHRDTDAAYATAQAGFDPAPAMRARIAGGIAMTALAVLLIVGMPLFLYHVVGSRWPARGPVMHDFEVMHLRGDAELLLGGLALAGWTLWAVFTLLVLHAVVMTCVDTLRWGVAAETWRDASNPVRWIAGLLIGAIAALWPAAANAAPPEPADQTVATRTLTDEELAVVTQGASTEAEITEGDTASADPTTEHATTHQVQRGESLWSIAGKYYGDPLRYMEIYEANQGQRFPDGRTLNDPKLIYPGWELTIPTDQPETEDDATEDAPPSGTVHTVGPGDSLWSLAEDYLGDGNRWKEIYDANTGRTFTDGAKLTDPEVIIDGWDLIIPGDTNSDTADGPSNEPPEPPANETPEPDTDAEAELEGEGEITDPDQETPDDIAEPSADNDNPTAPEDPTESDNDTDQAETTSTIPVGVWLGTGTFLAASTVALLAARAKRRKSPTPKANGEKGPVTGRLSDLEAMIDREQQRLSEPLGPETLPNEPVVPSHDAPNLPIAADRARTVDLTDLAVPAFGLTGPGHKSAARAAIITALDIEHTVTVTAQVADLLDIDPDTSHGPVKIAEDLEDALADPVQEQAGASHLVICAGDDIDQAGPETVAEHLALSGDRVIVLGDCPFGPTAVLAADGTLEAATGSVAGIEQFYIAEAALFHEVLRDHTEAAKTTVDTASTGNANDHGDAEPVPDARGSAEHDTQAHNAAGVSAGSGFRLCVFGDVELYCDGRPVKLKQRARALTLLAALASADQGRTMEELLDIVIPDRPLKGAREYLNIIKSNIRIAIRDLAADASLDPVPYDEKTATFRLDTTLITTDLADFDEAEQAAALATDTAEKAAALERLVSLHTGDLAPEIDVLDDLRSGYRAATQRACRTLADFHAQHGDPSQAAKYRARLAGSPSGVELTERE